MVIYTVWVGGVPDYEGNSLRKAKAVYNEWVNQGYDDVILEESENDQVIKNK